MLANNSPTIRQKLMLQIYENVEIATQLLQQ